MGSSNRRAFLGILAGSGATARALRARKLASVGAQLYTLRSVLPGNPLEVLKSIEAIGYREAELTADSLDRVSAALKQTSIKPVSLHLDSTLFTRNQEGLPAAIADAKTRGVEYAVCPYVAPQDRGGPDVMRRLGDTLNKAGELCRNSGMRLCYHNHAFDFEPSGSGTLLDVLLGTADPKLVGLELDIMWARVAGLDPVDVLKKYGSRVELLHLKNVAGGIPRQYNENVPPTAFREVGNGVIDIPAVLAAASQAGVKRYFVEQDQTPGNPVVSLGQSYRYLETVSF